MRSFFHIREQIMLCEVCVHDSRVRVQWYISYLVVVAWRQSVAYLRAYQSQRWRSAYATFTCPRDHPLLGRWDNLIDRSLFAAFRQTMDLLRKVLHSIFTRQESNIDKSAQLRSMNTWYFNWTDKRTRMYICYMVQWLLKTAFVPFSLDLQVGFADVKAI